MLWEKRLTNMTSVYGSIQVIGGILWWSGMFRMKYLAFLTQIEVKEREKLRFRIRIFKKIVIYGVYQLESRLEYSDKLLLWYSKWFALLLWTLEAAGPSDMYPKRRIYGQFPTRALSPEYSSKSQPTRVPDLRRKINTIP